MAGAIVVFAAALFALMIVAMGTAIGFATRGAMAGAREIVEVLHFVGAADSYIAGQFQGHFFRLGLKGAGIGGGAAAAVLRRGGARLASSPGARRPARRSPRCSAPSGSACRATPRSPSSPARSPS